jgi:galactokinase
MEELALQILQKFRSHFKDEPMLFRSPGRVNLIGEHTDYNEGFVLPAAVDKAIYFAISARNDDSGYLLANDLGENHNFALSARCRSEKRWPNYLIGVVDQLVKLGYDVPGFNCVFGGNIPIGAGMSSSAALEAGLAFALNRLFDLKIAPIELVKLAQRAENEFVGVRCGIMDQFINIFGKPRTVLKLDCRSLAFRYYPFDREDLRVVLCDTRVKRELASSEYNVRRRQCETGVELLRKYHPSIRSLRDVSLDMLEAHRSEFEPVICKRCGYVIRENIRVEQACQDLERGDFQAFGKRMSASHEGLRDEYEVSSRELDVLVEAASQIPGVLGARMMGAGFGGCTINLVEEKAVDGFSQEVSSQYRSRLGTDPRIYISMLQSGTEQIFAS